MDPKSDEGIFLGYSINSRAYRVFKSRTKVMTESINVITDDRGWNNEEDVLEYVGTSLSDIPTESNERSIDSNPPQEDPEPSHLNKGPSIRTQRDHPKELIIGDINKGVTTRSREGISNFCFVSKIEPNNGYTQIEGVEIDETYALVARLESARLLLGIACILKFKLFQMDINSAFLNGYLNEEVYVEQPKGFVDPSFPKHVYKLKKALYGLKEAPRAWYERLTEFLGENGYRKVA
ncbi:unnamed protein product [Vicia faba]|uniref:Gag-pol polyprotein n=1 Tax=Vicia faba TaxID=3906 RepID=A0AAV0Z7Q8_VICFA|nr:unnamed protein product [Vicia faba]